MTDELLCPDCDRPRAGRGRCPCGSFAAPVPPKLIRVPDPGAPREGELEIAGLLEGD